MSLQPGVIGVLGANKTMLDKIQALVQPCPRWITFLHTDELIHHYEKSGDKKVSNNNVHDTKALVEQFFRQTDKDEKGENHRSSLLLDITGLQPVHFGATINLCRDYAKRVGCFCFVLGAECLRVDFRMDSWLFPDAEWFHNETTQQVLQNWGSAMEFNNEQFAELITQLNALDHASSLVVVVERLEKEKRMEVICPKQEEKKEKDKGQDIAPIQLPGVSDFVEETTKTPYFEEGIDNTEPHVIIFDDNKTYTSTSHKWMFFSWFSCCRKKQKSK